MTASTPKRRLNLGGRKASKASGAPPSAASVDEPSPPSTSPTFPLESRVPLNVPTIYADSVIDIVYGIHTSKVVLGVEDGSNSLKPAGVVIIPTAALLGMSSAVISNLTSPETIKETAERMTNILNMMRGLSSSNKKS